MPVTVTASNGETFHLWQLPDAATPEPTDEHSFSVLRNEMGGGYRSARLLGIDTGVRRWRLNLPTLARSSVLPNTVTDVDGSTQVGRFEYVERLFQNNKITGKPFVYEWKGQYYLVDFEGETFSAARALPRIEIYNGDVILAQRRINGVTVYQVDRLGHNYAPEEWLAQWLEAFRYEQASANLWTGSYIPGEGSGNATGVGGLTKLAANQNGQDVIRFDGVNDYLDTAAVNAKTIREGFIVCKFREASFSGNFGLLTDQASGGAVAMRTVSGTTRFEDRGWAAGTYNYRLNGVEYTQANQQAPMNTWGVVHFRYTDGWAWTNGYRVGRDRETSGSYAPVDIGEIILCEYALPRMISREVTEYLKVKWGISSY